MTYYFLEWAAPNDKVHWLNHTDSGVFNKRFAIKFQSREEATAYRDASSLRKYYTVTEHQIDETQFENESRN